jgi:hypothetical protein
MRTTVTLDPDTEALLRRRMAEHGVSFKQALNDAIRDGLAPGSPERVFQTPTADMGVPTVNLDQAVRLAADLEDDELVRKARVGK